MNYTFNTCRYDILMSFYPHSNFDIAHMRKDASVSLPTQLQRLHPKAGEPNTEKKYEYTSPSKRLSEVVLWVGKVGLNGPGVGEREKLELDLFDTSRSPAPFFLLLRILSNLTSSLFSCCCIVAKICKIGDLSHTNQKGWVQSACDLHSVSIDSSLLSLLKTVSEPETKKFHTCMIVRAGNVAILPSTKIDTGYYLQLMQTSVQMYCHHPSHIGEIRIQIIFMCLISLYMPNLL